MSEQTCATCMFGAGEPDGRGICHWPFHADTDFGDVTWDANSMDPMPDWAERMLSGNGGERVTDRFDCRACPSFELREAEAETAPESERCTQKAYPAPQAPCKGRRHTVTETLTAFSRRKTVKLADRELGFSIPAGVSDAEIFPEVWAMQRLAILGYGRRMICVDGPLRPFTYRLERGELRKVSTPLIRLWLSRTKHAGLRVWSYIEMCGRVFWRHTFALAKTKRELDATRAALESALLQKEQA